MGREELHFLQKSEDSIFSNSSTFTNYNNHPLLFPPVLNRVFSHLSHFNLKKCRLICKAWEAELVPFVKHNFKVNLTKLLEFHENETANGPTSSIFWGLGRICQSFVIEDKDPLLVFKNLEKCISDSLPLSTEISQLPFTLSLKYLELKGIRWSPLMLRNLLQTLPFLEELRLPVSCLEDLQQEAQKLSPPRSPRTNKYISRSSNVPCNWKRDQDQASPSLSPLPPEFPSLRRIIFDLTIKDLTYFDYKHCSASSPIQLLQWAPNLEELYYPNIVQFTSPYENPARLLLEHIVTSDPIRFRSLSTLKIDTFLTNRDLSLLTERRQPFTSLQLTLTPDIHCHVFYGFLRSCADSLRTLNLTFRDGFTLNKEFPFLPNVEMSIILWNGGLDHLLGIERLKVLIFVLLEFELETEITEKARKFSYAETLEIHANLPEKMDLSFKILSLVDSSILTRLTLDWVQNSELTKIFQDFRNLEEFTVIYGGFTDSGITGVPPGLCRDEYCDSPASIRELKRRSGISDLKKLRSLQLGGDLTDFLIIFGICFLPSLQRLELRAKGLSKLGSCSIRNLSKMGKSLDVLRLKNFMRFGCVSAEAWEELKEAFIGRELDVS